MNEIIIKKNIKELSEVFGALKAEWVGPRMFDWFTEPSYFPQMTTARPCVLVGGRGTGKTTVLRGLSYEGQYAIRKSKPGDIADWPYYGFYYRVDTNRVSAFQGPELVEGEWVRKFAHYMNLHMCIQVLKFLLWFKDVSKIDTEIETSAQEMIGCTLHLPTPQNNVGLLKSLQHSLAEFENHINNIATNPGPMLSMQGAPVQAVLQSVTEHAAFKGKNFFFLIDEYENLLDYQQKTMNTLIKHAGELYSFKIGVRELGWRVRSTLNENEQLISPADYSRIDITQVLKGEVFEELAYNICQYRLSVMSKNIISNKAAIPDIKNLLPGLTDEAEANLLGIQSIVAPVISELSSLYGEKVVEGLNPLMLYLIKYWATKENKNLKMAFDDFLNNEKLWKTRLDNYKYALLYTLRKGKGGIRKYYSGWDVFVQISGSNIRYLLQLVEESLALHLRNGESLLDPISPEIQTLAAQGVGRVNLTELEGLSVRGAKLTKLLLGLGRIFGVMASSPEGHAPEVNQFEVIDSGRIYDRNEVDALLKAAVMHLALQRWSGSKPTDEGETRDWDYMVHPIFTPFFNFSYRKKRKFLLAGDQLLSLITDPNRTIKEILLSNNREVQDPLPEQLQLFEMYYATDKT